MENLNVHNNTIHHRTPSDLENNNSSDMSSNSDVSDVISKNSVGNTTTGSNPEETETVDKTSNEIKGITVNPALDDSMPVDNFVPSDVIVNIISDDEGEPKLHNLVDYMAEKDTNFSISPQSIDLFPRTPRSKSCSLNSDEMQGALR